MKQGFTLIELLVVISIISLLGSIILNNVSDVKQFSIDSKKISELHQIHKAIMMYYYNEGHFPFQDRAESHSYRHFFSMSQLDDNEPCIGGSGNALVWQCLQNELEPYIKLPEHPDYESVYYPPSNSEYFRNSYTYMVTDEGEFNLIVFLLRGITGPVILGN